MLRCLKTPSQCACSTNSEPGIFAVVGKDECAGRGSRRTLFSFVAESYSSYIEMTFKVRSRRMHRFLVPIDNSENAARALQYAIRLAKEIEPAELHIVHAHGLPLVYGEIAVYLMEKEAQQMLRQHSEDILTPAINKASGITFSSEILVGDPPAAIATCAEERSCDAIIMGTRGMGAIGNLVMGSVATKVIHLTKLPVTLVK
jgi:nucleotide-binding universal stress UspA family protein